MYIYAYLVWNIIHTFLNLYIFMYTYMYIYKHIDILANIYAYSYISKYIETHTYVYMYIYNYLVRNTFWNTFHKTCIHIHVHIHILNLYRITSHTCIESLSNHFTNVQRFTKYSVYKTIMSIHRHRVWGGVATGRRIYRVPTISKLLKIIGPAEYRLFYRALLQKRLMILRSLLIVATPYESRFSLLHHPCYVDSRIDDTHISDVDDMGLLRLVGSFKL